MKTRKQNYLTARLSFTRPLPFGTKTSLLYFLMRGYAEHKQLGKVLGSRVTMHLGPCRLFEPDILFVRRERLSILRERRLESAADLILRFSRHGQETTTCRKRGWLTTPLALRNLVLGVRSLHALLRSLALFGLGRARVSAQNAHTEPLSSPSERRLHTGDMKPRTTYDRLHSIIYKRNSPCLWHHCGKFMWRFGLG